MMPTTYFTVLLSKAASVQVTSPASFLSFPDSAMGTLCRFITRGVAGTNYTVPALYCSMPKGRTDPSLLDMDYVQSVPYEFRSMPWRPWAQLWMTGINVGALIMGQFLC